jgi:predicted metal-dependent phosphotriesterase family hydrolase
LDLLNAVFRSALDQLDILEKAGVRPQRIVIGHLGNLVDREVKVHKEISKRGAFVGFDRQGGPWDAQQVPMVVVLIEAGYADRVLFRPIFPEPRSLRATAVQDTQRP